MDPAFKEAFENGQKQLVWEWIPSDLETPVSAYLKLCAEKPHAFLLESVEGGDTLGRYSILGYDPDLIWTCKGLKVEGEDLEPVASLKKHLKDSTIDLVPEGLPPMVVSGLFGYIGYDMVRSIENIPNDNPDDLKIPDAVL